MGREHVPPLALLALPPLVLLAGPILGISSIVPFDRPPHDAVLWDAVQQDTPWKIEVQRAYASGRLPLYSFGAFSGSPLLANDQSAALYPGNAAYAFLPAARALAPTLAIHLILAAWGAYALVRALGGGRAGGVVAGACLSLSAPMMAFLPHPQMTATLALAPWVLWGLLRAAQIPRGGRIATAGALVGMQLLSGHLQYAAFTWIAALALVPTRRARWRAAALALALGAALGAAQILPTIDLMQNAARKPLAFHGGLVDRYEHALPLGHLADILFPERHGNPEVGRYWGRVNFRMFCPFVGLVPLALVLGGGVRRPALPFTALALAALALALATPLYDVLHLLPGFASLKPARCLMLFALAAAVAAGLSVDRGKLWATMAIAALYAVATPIDRATFLDPRVAQGLARAVMALAALAVAQRAFPARAPLAAALVAVAELLAFAAPFARTYPVVEPYPSTPAAEAVRAAGMRFSSTRWDTLLPNTAMALGLEDARGTDSFIPIRYHELARRIDPRSDDMVRVRLASGTASPAHALLAPVSIEAGSGIPPRVALARDPRAPAPAFFPARPRAVRSQDEALAAVLDPSFVPATDAVVEGPTPSGPPAARVLGMTKSWNRIALDVEIERPSLLVVLHGFVPGWSTRTSRGTLPVVPADAAFMGALLDAGERHVELRYEPPSFRLGLFLSALGTALALIMATSRVGRAGH